MWTVIGESEGREARDAEGSHAYLILTQEDSSMVSVLNYFCHIFMFKNRVKYNKVICNCLFI